MLLLVKPACWVWAAVTAAVLLSNSCAQTDGETLDVFAAASLTNAFTELAENYEENTPAINIRLNFAGSSTLREQLVEGADADVFASASASIMDSLVGAGHVDGDPEVFAKNRLVLAVPAGNPGRLAGMADLSRAELFIGICADAVPCGELASAIVDEAGVEASIDTYEPNVRALVNRLIDGELDAGLVYASDVSAANGSLVVVPTAVSERLTSYPIVALSDDDRDAQAFVDFVTSDDGLAVLLDWGFVAP